jgi:TonB family protein
MRTLTLARLGALLLLLAAAAAPQPASAQTAPAPAWQVDWGNQYCTLIRPPDPGTNEIVGLRMLPGAEFSSIVILAPRSTALPDPVDAVTLAPSGQSFDVHARPEDRAHDAHAVVIGSLPRTFWDALAGAQELQIKAGGHVRRRIALPNAAAAVRALRQCASDAFREWGVDEAAWSALQRLPHSTNAMGMTDNDYPTDELDRNGQGQVVVRVTVSAEGRATACAIVATSNTPSMDRATCPAVMSRARFTPALDAQGRPTEAQIVSSVRFLAGG